MSTPTDIPMPCVTLKQPWAWAVCHAGKRVENRIWEPSLAVGERLGIHAGKGWDLEGHEHLRVMLGDVPDRENMVFGAIVAECRFGGLVGWPGGTLPQEQLDRWFVGPVGWVLTAVKIYSDPIPCRGRLGLWAWDGQQ